MSEIQVGGYIVQYSRVMLLLFLGGCGVWFFFATIWMVRVLYWLAMIKAGLDRLQVVEGSRGDQKMSR